MTRDVSKELQELTETHRSLEASLNNKVRILVDCLESLVGFIYSMQIDGCFDDYDDAFVENINMMLKQCMMITQMEKSRDGTMQ